MSRTVDPDEVGGGRGRGRGSGRGGGGVSGGDESDRRSGGAIVFDDSFEHEVAHSGPADRFVLLVVLNHPDLRYDHETIT